MRPLPYNHVIKPLLLPAMLTSFGLAAGLGCAVPLETFDNNGALAVAVPDGKADGSGFTECELDAVVDWLNTPNTQLSTLQQAGVNRRAATGLMDHRNGLDRLMGTEDDDLFDDIVEVDDVHWVGPSTMRSLVGSVQERCQEADAGDVQVIFSPQPFEQSHLAATIEIIDSARRSVDIAMYSFRDNRVLNSVERAVQRGVTVRVVSNNAADDRNDDGGGISGDLEDIGAEVRWINKIMHHKFALVDGVQTSLEQIHDATLITGSGNWSTSAGTRYDENTLIIRSNQELLLAFQAEFNHLWDNGRPFEWNESIQTPGVAEVSQEAIPDSASAEALFTSANFRHYESTRYGPTFSPEPGMTTVADRLVELIWSAEESIDIASGHLRSRPISEALIAKRAADPRIAIRVLLDGQEYVSEWAHNNQQNELEECLEEAGADEGDREDCLARGYYFGYECSQAGIDVRYKYYSYRWHYSYAEQMHHKYLIIDGRTVATGSYNLSDNAERNTMENMVILDGEVFPELVNSFMRNFNDLWDDPSDAAAYEDLMNDIVDGDGFPLVFEPMVIEWDAITELKRTMRENCSDINSNEFRSNPRAHTYCPGN